MPEIWELTARSPDREISLEDELAWIRHAISDPTGHRFAILANGVYVGNIYLTDVADGEAEYHIFLGDERFRGKGVARRASELIIDFGKERLGLRRIRLSVHRQNARAVALYRSLGFVEEGEDGVFLKMALCLSKG